MSKMRMNMNIDDAVIKRLLEWSHDGEECPTCTEKMEPIKTRAFWCSSCGTVGETYTQFQTHNFIRFYAPKVITESTE